MPQPRGEMPHQLGGSGGGKGEGKARMTAFSVVFPYPWVSHPRIENMFFLKSQKFQKNHNLNLPHTEHYRNPYEW